MNAKRSFIVAIIACLSTAGCGTTGPEQSLLGGNRVTTASTNQMFAPEFEGFSDEALFHLLDPDSGLTFGTMSGAEKVRQLRLAFRKANKDEAYGPPHRSQVQDRLIAASNQRCNLYVTYLKRVSTYTNGVFGTLTTVLGGAGAIVTGENAARILSGLAGITSGTRAELNQAIFESVATSVIIPGIHKTRADLLREIEQKRSRGLDQYTVEGAIADAISYHGACSMDTGIAYAQRSIQSYEDIGIKRFAELQTQLGIARSASEAFLTGPIGTLVVAEKVLVAFGKRLEEYASRIKRAKQEPSELMQMHAELTAAVTDGELRARANELDAALKTAVFDFGASFGVARTQAYKVLEVQQNSAREFVALIEAREAVLQLELKKLGI